MGWMSKNLQIFLKITILCLLKMQVPHHLFKYVARCFHGRSSYAGTPGHWMQILMEIWDSLLLLLFSHLVVSDSVAPWTAACQASLPLIISQSFSKLMSIALVMPSSHLVLCRHLLLLPSIFPSIRDFSSESASCIRWPNYWSFSFSISPSNQYSGLISLKIDWFDLLAVQGTFRSLLQHHSLMASNLWCSAFFMVQLSQLYVPTGKTIALTLTWANFPC